MWRDALAIAVLHALACIVARAFGFDHVSDDDFARVTIAQAFAHAPKLDPSGTSWLPFPFWLHGGFMIVLGRSLTVARAEAIAFASFGAAAPYLALRFAEVPRGRALAGTAFAFGTPWAIWLGAATVPESVTASLTAAGAIGLAAEREDRPLASVAAALAIGCACLSRYEAWPVAAALALGLAARAVRRRRGRARRLELALAVVCAAGPLAWMAWNAHVHDGPLHFFRRVSAFKRAIGEGSSDPLGAVLLYPHLLVTTRPEVTVPALLLLLSPARRLVPARWVLPLVAAGAEIAFLAYGNARDGAPAHHPERALLGVFVILALFTVDAGSVAVEAHVPARGARWAWVAGGSVALLWLASVVRDLADPPGQSPAEDRSAQVARGLALRAEHADETSRFVVTPCAFEHFALLAAYAAPEHAEVKPRTNDPVTSACPQIIE